MAGKPDPKLKLLILKDFIERRSDEGHGVSMRQIIDYLSAEGFAVERKSVYSDIEILRRYGMDIALVRGGGAAEYRLLSREFELPELKLLVDAVSASKFITRRKSEALIKKLASLASEREAAQLRRNVFVQRRVKAMNESIFYTVDAIHAAINEGVKLSFRYYEYGADKKRRYRRQGERYIVSPLSLNYAEENYYLFAYDASAVGVRTYRVDRMADASELDEVAERNEITEAFDPGRVTREMFSMYHGDSRIITLQCDASLATVVVDRFGEDVHMSQNADGSFDATAEVMVSPTFYGWIFGLGGRAQITAPEDVKAEYLSLVKAAQSG